MFECVMTLGKSIRLTVISVMFLVVLTIAWVVFGPYVLWQHCRLKTRDEDPRRPR